MKKYHLFLFFLILVLTCKSVNTEAINNSFYEETTFSEEVEPSKPSEPVEPVLLEFGFPVVSQVVEISSRRKELTREYCIRHYNRNSYLIEVPRMIVIHYTGVSSLGESFAIYRDDIIPAERTDINGFGRVNIGVHFLVDKDGSVYSMLPENMIGRHTVGFNHLSIAIENVGVADYELTSQQVEANARIISYLGGKYPTIRFLFGHHEYLDKEKAHFLYFKAEDPFYKPRPMADPGVLFMKNLRDYLLQEYNLKFID
ncbi:MAG: N-acetylmuramoyl-L-alanine amidase [Spirochaetales bacterium]|nr:N-acetylmuramoyl-L-alanine amidase [Spirochaetales bacterium]